MATTVRVAWAALATVKVRSTLGAAFQVALPPWLARIVQSPAPTIVTVVAATVQTPVVSEPNETGRPEVAVALTVNGALPKVFPPRAAKVIVWSALPIAKVRSTVGARS